MLQGIKRLLAAGVVAVVLALPAQAIAQSQVTSDAYEESSITVVGNADPNDPAASGTGSGTGTGSGDPDGLPFTGLDIGLAAAMGGGLLLLGVGMRRMTRGPETA